MKQRGDKRDLERAPNREEMAWRPRDDGCYHEGFFLARVAISLCVAQHESLSQGRSAYLP